MRPRSSVPRRSRIYSAPSGPFTSWTGQNAGSVDATNSVEPSSFGAYALTSSPAPATGLATGAFEIERTRQRNPADRPRPQQAAGIEAAFVPSDDPEIADEIEDEIEDEDIEAAGESAREFTGTEDPDEDRDEARDDGARGDADGENGERTGRRRWRNRRRGRRGGRHRQNQPGQNQPGEQTVSGADDAGEARAIHQAAEGDAGDASHDASSGGQSSEDRPSGGQFSGDRPSGGQRRSRRRRAGSRPAEGPRPAAAEVDRFGAVPDEIDTTPTMAAASPGAPAMPAWSLSDDIPDTTPSENDKGAAEPAKPARKGWWQRTFSGE